VQGLEDLKKILRDRAGFEVVDATASESQIRLVGRVPPNASSHWVLIVHRLLVSCSQASWKVDISRQYFLRELSNGPKLFYAWRCIFQAAQLSSQLPDILTVIHNTPKPSRVELQEFPLSGAGSSRTQHTNGRGAGSVDRVPLGPMAATAAMAQRMGGQQ